ncbi:MAG: cellulase family glycosylhydrolase [Ruminococcus sp.]|nr:cellulase family glycosylhydrolase [Ruminococcus sp.]
MKTRSRKTFALSVVCAMAVSCLSLIEPVRAEAAFEKNAKQTVADMGLGWNLGNSLDSYSGTTIGSNRGSTSSETAWGNPATTKAMIDMVKKSGVKTVRVPVTWYEHMDPVTYKIDETWMNRVEEIVDYVLEDDMYCIINVHHDTGEKGWLKANSTNLQTKKAMFTSIWEQVSDNFADYGDKLLFEGFNEILDESSNQWWIPSSEACPIANDLNQIFVDTVRSSGGNNAKRNLICNTYCGGANYEITSQYVLPKDTISDRLIVEAHVYQPFEFTHESYPNITSWTNSPLDNVLDNLNRTFSQKGIPVIIGEFGCANKNNMDQITSWAKYLVEKCTNYGMCCIWWDNGSQYKIYNRRTCKVSQPELLNTMLAAAGSEVYIDPQKKVRGDINGDGKLNDTDKELLQNYLIKLSDNISMNADINLDGEIDVIDLVEMKRAILNPETTPDENNLCANEDNWASWTDTSEGAQGELFYVDNGVAMQVDKGGKNDWNAQFFYDALTLEQGATYKLSFDYISDKPQSTSFVVNQGHGEYLPYYSDTLKWSTTSQHYTATFDYTSKTDNACRVTFNLGGGGVNVPYKATITNLSLVKISGGSSSSTGSTTTETTVAAGTNMAADASKFSGWANTEGGASASFKNLSNGLQIAVNNSGSDVWHVQGMYPDITLEKGATYEISFDYQANKSVDMGYKFQQNYDPYDQYFNAPLSFTTQKQHYSKTFAMTEPTDDNVACVFTCGGVNTPVTVTITDLVIKKIS